MSKELNILYQFDDNYAPYAGISMLSLFENNQEIKNLNIYCAAQDISEKNREYLEKTAKDYHRKLDFLNVDCVVKQIQELKLGEWNGSRTTWIKMFIIKEMIEQMDSLIYIDSDTLIQGSLMSLCDLDFQENAIACVIDSLSFESVKRLGITEDIYYYNAGVMIFNFKYFRKNEDFYSNMIEHLKENIERYLVNDQDLLNDYFRGKILKLLPKYNLQGIHYMYTEKQYFSVYGKYPYYQPEDIKDAREDTKIIHFFRVLGDYPWVKNNYHPIKGKFNQWKSKSYWKDMPEIEVKRKLVFRIERVLYRCMPKRFFLQLFKWITN